MNSSAMSSMYQYRVSRIWQELEAKGKSNTDLEIEDILHLDQYHYLGTEAIAVAAKLLDLNQQSLVLDIGSGVGGTARYLTEKYGCKVTALELQDHLHEAAVTLTKRCGLDAQVECLAGDILEFMPNQKYDAWLSLLVFLHIGDRSTLFNKSAQVLKPGGTFYIEDYFARNSLSPADLNILNNVVACPSLPSRDRYLEDLTKAGFVDLRFEEVTDLWQPWVKGRFEQFVANREEYLRLHGSDMVEAQTNFYQAIATLFQAGNVGGARIWGSLPIKSN
jgi:sarcosine/dimethylglycine N-methyltransferase